MKPGIAGQVAAFGLMVWATSAAAASRHCGSDAGRPGHHRTLSLRLRHPIDTAICLGSAGVVSNPSGLAAAPGVVLTAGAIVRMFCEERLVVEDTRIIGSTRGGRNEWCLMFSDREDSHSLA